MSDDAFAMTFGALFIIAVIVGVRALLNWEDRP